jgi:hypothetical protein
MSRFGNFRNMNGHMDLVSTMVMDTGLIVMAIACRALLLWALERLTSGHASWAVRTLEVIADIGMLATAALYTVSDLIKRLILVGRELAQVMRAPESPSFGSD